MDDTDLPAGLTDAMRRDGWVLYVPYGTEGDWRPGGQAHHGRQVMAYDSAIQAAQLIADEPLDDCDQTIEPPQEGQGHCIVCNRPPEARLVLRRDGEEMAWVSVCRGHSYTPSTREEWKL